MPVDTLTEVRARLTKAGQDHLLTFHARLAPPEQAKLLAQITELDLDSLPRLIDEYVKHKPEFRLPPNLAPAPYYPKDPTSPNRKWDRAKMKAAGEDMIRRGKVAAFVVAGGQGSRLGYEGPKGCFPAGAVTGKCLFAFFADNLLAAKDRYGVRVPWYVMTSPLNHAATVDFFDKNNHFGLDPRDVMFFPQGVMPSLDIKTGRVLLAGKGELATNPDGHGGSIKALKVSGALADMRRRGVEHISYFQVDNPCVRILDPVFIGLHAAAPDSSGEMSSKMVPKVIAEEKVGVFCSVPVAPDRSAARKMLDAVGDEFADRGLARDWEILNRYYRDDATIAQLEAEFGLKSSHVKSILHLATMRLKAGLRNQMSGSMQSTHRVQVIEYSDLPMELQRERLDDGSLKFIAGSIAIHILGVEFVERVADDPKFALPYHRAEKKIPCVDLATGEVVTPKENNGVKLERFVFDALESCRASIVYETDRLEEFAPIKNASGVDSVESSKELQTERAAKWLEACGVRVARVADGPRKGKADCVIELSPRTGMSAEELKGAKLPKQIGPGERVSL